jgi:type II secretory pathway pseudopilin PulG
MSNSRQRDFTLIELLVVIVNDASFRFHYVILLITTAAGPTLPNRKTALAKFSAFPFRETLCKPTPDGGKSFGVLFA